MARIYSAPAPAALLVRALAQIDAVLDPHLERGQHLRPAHAIAVAPLETGWCVVPAAFFDLDQGPSVIGRLEGHRYLELVVRGYAGIVTLPCGPAQHDLRVRHYLLDLDREGA